MKRIISLFLTLGMILTTLCVPTIASAEDTDVTYYINATFEDGTTNPFTAERTSGGTAGDSEVVDAATEGVGTSGKVLKITSGGGNNDYIVEAQTAIDYTTSPKIVMEARFLSTSTNGVSRLFSINNTGRARDKGLIALRKHSEVLTTDAPMFVGQNDNSTQRPIDGTNANGYLVDENGVPLEFAANTWYRVKMTYLLNQAGKAIEKLSVYDDSDNLITSATNIAHDNDGSWPVFNISCIGFGKRDWGTADTLYIDDVKVYDYVAPSALAISSNTVTAGTTVTIPFSQDLDGDTIDDILITGVDAANPTITSVEVSGKNLILTFEEALTPDAIYALDLTGLYSTLETTLTNSVVTLKTVPAATTSHLNVTFEDGTINPFAVDGTATASIVDAAAEGVGTSGKVYKISTAGNRSASGAKIDFDTPITASPLVIEGRFRTTSHNGVRNLFTLSTDGSRNRDHGALTVRQPGGHSSPVMFMLQTDNNENQAFGNGNTHGYLVHNNGSAAYIVKDTWYRVKMIYTVNQAGKGIEQIYLYDENNNLIERAENVIHDLDASYPLFNIDKIGFKMSDWGAAETLYIDDIHVYNYTAASALALENSSVADDVEISPVDAEEITLDFNNRILKSSLEELAITVDGSDVDYTAELIGDSTKVKIIITDAISAGDYVIDYSALKDVNYASASGTLSFSVKSDIFVESIVFDSDVLTIGDIGATVNIVNSTGSASTVTVLVALYKTENGGNRLVDVVPVFDYPVAVGNTPVPATITVPAGTTLASAKVQVIVLDSISNLKPLSKAKWLTTSGNGDN